MFKDGRFVEDEPPRTADEKAAQLEPEPLYDYAKTDVWLRDEHGKSFLDYLVEQRKRVYSALETVSGDQPLGYLQGQLKILNWLLRLREES
jgi:hypothetical protein